MTGKVFAIARLVALFFILALIVAGCAGRKVELAVPGGEGEKTIALQASSYRFEPNVVRAHAGDRLLLQVQNQTGTEHNLTVKDPGGSVVLAFDLPAGRISEGRLNLERKGEYRFYCDKPLHPSMGMTGTILVQ